MAQAKTRPAAKRQNGASRSSSGKPQETVKKAGRTVGRAASKAKLPLAAGGAALAGAAGGLAIGMRKARRGRGIGGAIPRRKVNVAKAAKEVGAFGAQMGQLAAELQNTREAANDSTHRSPIEVVLEALTARRSRAH
jgi:hypothetical protein